jgi:hypothetical protein
MLRFLVIAAVLTPSLTAAQSMDHSAHQSSPKSMTQSGQAAFAAIAEVVRALEADPTTDWSRVSIDALRSHLQDMDDVVLRSVVRSRTVPGGVELDVTGTGRTIAAIRRMVTAHATQVDDLAEYVAAAREIPSGVRIRVTASDSSAATRLRALGFAGILTIGDHHAQHHVMIARGMASHR